MTRFTATQFKKEKRQEIFNTAYKGEEVIINHDRYKDVEFILSTRKREALRPPAFDTSALTDAQNIMDETPVSKRDRMAHVNGKTIKLDNSDDS